MLEADGEKFHFLNCYRSLGSQMNRVGIAFPIWVKQTENTIPLQEDWSNMPIMVLSLDLLLLSNRRYSIYEGFCYTCYIPHDEL